MHAWRTAGAHVERLDVDLPAGEYGSYLIEYAGEVLAIDDHCVERHSLGALQASALAAGVAVTALSRSYLLVCLHVFSLAVVRPYLMSSNISSTLAPGGVIGSTLSSSLMAHCSRKGPSVLSISLMASFRSARSMTVREGIP